MHLKAQQGHAYDFRGEKVVAMESGDYVRVGVVPKQSGCWFSRFYWAVDASLLKPLPMNYFHGQVPQ